ncbi:MAG: alpha-ketoglutarate-dependent dioxygenase AlkB [Pseudobdellovibrionaceae bacterium]
MNCPSRCKISHPMTNLIYQKNAISTQEKALLLSEIASYQPIWEHRYSKSNPPPQGKENRMLLRPVYWLGNWQFACLNYYHPPKGIDFRCVKAEAFPKTMDKIVKRIENTVRTQFLEKDVPRSWHLNTCLINFYGDRMIDGKKTDAARVGEHRDFEPGPVASVSFGERALFQFVKSTHRDGASQVILQQWLEDSSLQIFGGDRFKKQLFHRVQRVENKLKLDFSPKVEGFKTRRINLTFRYVPTEHIFDYHKMPVPKQKDISPYIKQLKENSAFFSKIDLPNE